MPFPRIVRRPGHRLWIGGPVPPGADAWTLGSLVIVRRSHADSAHLLRHELEHVAQYRELGVVGFLLRYVTDYLGLRLVGFGHDVAYRRIPAEISAEWRTRRELGIGVVRPEVDRASDPIRASDRSKRSLDSSD